VNRARREICRSDWVAASMLRRVEPKLSEIEVKDNG